VKNELGKKFNIARGESKKITGEKTNYTRSGYGA
jgi:hypothetical protein